MTNATWHYEVQELLIGNEGYYYCPDCDMTFSAAGEEMKGTVKFLNADGSVISETVYPYGKPVTAPADPMRAPDNACTYTFAGWDKDIANCTGDATYTATYAASYLNDAGGTITVGSNRVHPGEQICLPVSLTNNLGISGAIHTVEFDPALLKFVKAEFQGAFAEGTAIINEEKLSEGKITILWVNSKDVTDSGDMYHLVFEALETETDQKTDVIIDFSIDSNTNLDGESVIFTPHNGYADIRTYWPGDLSGDQTCAMVDLIMLGQCLTGFDIPLTEKQLLAADANEDGLVNIHDVILLNQWILEASI